MNRTSQNRNDQNPMKWIPIFAVLPPSVGCEAADKLFFAFEIFYVNTGKLMIGFSEAGNIKIEL